MEFATRMWPAKRRRRVERYVRWKFRGPDRGPVNGLLLAVAEGQVVGQLGLIPATVQIGAEVLECQWACDLMVDSSMRRKGIGSLLFASAMARDVITLGSNPSASANMTMSRIGFKSLAGPRLMMLPVRLPLVLSWKMPASLKKAIPLLSKLGQPLASMRCRSLAKKNAEAINCSWKDVMTPIAAKQAATTDPHIVHDEQFMKWRCSGLEGYTRDLQALRTEQGGYVVMGSAEPFFDVYDWSAHSQKEFLALFQAIYKMVKESSAEVIRVLAQNDEEESWLKKVGFLPARYPCRIMCYPPDRLIPKYKNFCYSMCDSDESL